MISKNFYVYVSKNVLYIYFFLWNMKKVSCKYSVPFICFILLRNDCSLCHKKLHLNYSGRFPNGNSLGNILLHPSILIASFFTVERTSVLSVIRDSKRETPDSFSTGVQNVGLFTRNRVDTIDKTDAT